MVTATLYTDPGCPWAYSASPALASLHWRYGEQLRWRLVVIGLAEDPKRYVDRGYTPATQMRGYRSFRDRFGMPFALTPRSRVIATGPACRAIVAARRHDPGSEWATLRALQLAWFTTPALLDEPAGLRDALGGSGLDADALLAMLDTEEVAGEYARDREAARQAAGGPAEFQGRTAQTDGPVRYTAPSVVFEGGGQRLEVGGFQPLEAYDVVLAHLDRSLERRPPPDGPLELLRAFDGGLTTQEIAVLLAAHLEPVDRTAAEDALIDLCANGLATRTPCGGDAIWTAAA